MTTYLLKTILCSGIFYGFYFLFLEKEKMHRFNRFYLLATLILSFSIPLITIEKQADILPVTPWLVSSPNAPASAHKQILLSQEWLVGTPTTGRNTVIAQEKINLLPIISWSVYGLITLILLFRFIKNLGIIWHKIRKNTPVNFKSSTFILLEEKLIPHSFLQYIFLNKSDYENGEIENEILQHEYAHVRQKHSFDVILMEIIHCICWFNPILIFYRKAIQLNHEFLADEAVIETFNNPVSYQYLLINKASQASSLSLTSQFNYLITKKRLIMMTKNTSPQRAFLIKLLFAPLFVGTVLMLSSSVEAQEKVLAKAISTEPKKSTDNRRKLPYMKDLEFTKEGVSPELMKEYENIIKANTSKTGKWMMYLAENTSLNDKNRMIAIFKMMSKKQQESVDVALVYSLNAPMSKNQPTEKQFQSFKNADKFGVWIDDKKVKNSVLNNYKPEDFDNVFVSRLEGGAKIGRTYDFQIDLMTKANFAKYNKEALAKPEYDIKFMFPNKKTK